MIVIAFYTSTFPESWKGAEIIILYAGSGLFIAGKYIEEIIDALKNV
jgi:hypothetical protein